MKCWNCKADLIWGGDNNIVDEDGQFMLETNLHCPDCDAQVIITTPLAKAIKDEEGEDSEALH